ncbi:MAG: SHOCT domain-containing protein [Thermogemmata sp.]|jgi:hypothetical protein|uniref:SHOCT domain-containing protein n=1 Tax=Thermogemmata fonticola TaxID=2755323 RepID=A0A7V8VCD1_9BACT|nr:SHOCT domain-containing protein [Thermogemmata fonticola]MBA2225177.1 SHOCT domain-containing protein [Thermogemmata fonticola]MCX8140900.1 SHOCT domain-containing protein [Gemmataceae bacterium]GIW84362.1 MAG: hypothetical protein KatS3mg107_0022 [Gemmataceae bacterium]
MSWWGLLLAQVGRPDKDPLRQPEVIWGTVALAVALFAGAFIIWLVDRWRKRLGQQQAAFDELTEYRQMLENGEITEEEYQRLRAKVSRRIHSGLQSLPNAGVSSPTAAPSSTPPQRPTDDPNSAAPP